MSLSAPWAAARELELSHFLPSIFATKKLLNRMDEPLVLGVPEPTTHLEIATPSSKADENTSADRGVGNILRPTWGYHGRVRRVTIATMIVVALVIGRFAGDASAVMKPYFGVYTANVLLGGGGHLEASNSVLDPPTKVDMQFDCGRPKGLDTITDVLNTPAIPLRFGSFKYVATVKLSKITTVSENNASIAQSSYTASVDVSGTFNSHGQFTGTARLGGSPCGGTAYIANRKAPPAPSARDVASKAD